MPFDFATDDQSKREDQAGVQGLNRANHHEHQNVCGRAEAEELRCWGLDHRGTQRPRFLLLLQPIRGQ